MINFITVPVFQLSAKLFDLYSICESLPLSAKTHLKEPERCHFSKMFLGEHAPRTPRKGRAPHTHTHTLPAHTHTLPLETPLQISDYVPAQCGSTFAIVKSLSVYIPHESATQPVTYLEAGYITVHMVT